MPRNAMSRASADALARKWVAGEVAPEDFNPAVAEWKLEAAVRALVKTGDISQKQVVEEVQRRQRAGWFSEPTTTFVDRYPNTWSGLNAIQNPIPKGDDE